MNRNIFSLLLIPLLAGCIGMNMSEENVELTSSVDSIVAEAEFASATASTKTVVIRSNRSWFAHLDDLDHPIDPSDSDAKVRWGTLSIDHHQNLTNTTDETEVIITFNPNYSPDEVNGVLNIYCEGGIKKSIPVSQKGLVFRVSAESESQTALCEKDTVSVAIDCNTKWMARVAEDSSADVKLDVSNGFGNGNINVIFGENFSQTEDKIARIIISARECEDYELIITQTKSIPYLFVLPEYDGKVISGENSAQLKIRSNSSWTAEIVESELDGFTIVNSSASEGTSLPQEVNVTFEANPAVDPYDIKTAKIRFNVEGMSETVEYTFSQRGVFVMSFDDNSCFTPEIPNTLNSGNTHPDPDNYNNNLSRPGRVNTDVDEFVYTQGEHKMTLELSQYIRHDSSTNSLYVMGAGKLPHLKFSGMEELTLRKMTVACTGAGWFAGNIVKEDHKLADKKTPEYTDYITQASWQQPDEGQLHNLEFDLTEKGLSIEPGEGCTLRTSSANNTASQNCTKMYIKTVTFKYL